MKRIIIVTSLIACCSLNAKAEDPLTVFREQTQQLCNSGAGILGARCAANYLQTIKDIDAFCESKGCKDNPDSLKDYNEIHWAEYQRRAIEIIEEKNDETRKILVEAKVLCQMYHSLLASKGLMKVVERMDVDDLLPGYARNKEETLVALSDAEEAWKESCL